jgi:dihydrofolate reductase
MRKLVLLAHVSLDGYVAGPKGELDGFPEGDENLGFVCDLTKEADAALLGRVSFQLLDAYWPKARDRRSATKNEIAYSNWYNYAKKVVISKTIGPKNKKDKLVIISRNIVEEVRKIKEQPGKDILIFGSPSVSKLLMEKGLIDSYWIFVNPVLFCNGISLFTGLKNKMNFKVAGTKMFVNGEIAINYVPGRP